MNEFAKQLLIDIVVQVVYEVLVVVTNVLR